VRARACCAFAETGTEEACASSMDLRARETVVRVMGDITEGCMEMVDLDYRYSGLNIY